MAMNKQRRTSNINNIVTYDTLKNVTIPANLTVQGLTQAGFVKSDGNGLFSVDTTIYQAALPSQTGQGGKFLTTNGSALSWGTVSTANIYTDNGTLTGNRTVDTSIFTLSLSGFIFGSDGTTGNVNFITKNTGTTIALANSNVGGGSAIWSGTNATPISRVIAMGNGDIWMLPTSGVIIGGTSYANYKLDVQGTGRFTNNVTITPVNGGTINLGLSNNVVRFTDNGGYSRFNIAQNGISNSSSYIGGGNGANASIQLDSTGVYFGYPSNQTTANTWNFSRPFVGASVNTTLFNITTVNNNAFTTTSNLTGIYINPDPQYWARVIALQNTVGDVLFNTTSGSVIIGGTGTTTYKLDVQGTGRFTNTISYNGNLTPLNTAAYSLGISSSASLGKITAYANNGISALQSIEFGYYSTSLNNVSGLSNSTHNNFSFRLYGNHVVTTGGGGTYTDFRISPTYNFSGNTIASTVYGISYEPTLTNTTNTTVVAFRNTVGDVNFNTISGSVIIGGTGTTTYKLDVNGTARVSGDFAAAGNISFPTFSTTRIGANASGAFYFNLLGAGTGNQNLAIGNNAAALGNYAIAINNAQAQSGGIAISYTRADNGDFAAASAITFSGLTAISNVYFGSGKYRQNPDGSFTTGAGADYAINGSGASGTNLIGGNITIAGGKGTGTGTSGDVIISTATTTTSGTTLQSLTNRWWVKGSTGVLSNVSSPNASAITQIDSTTQGFLPPRMTSSNRSSISTPATGLVVYQTDGTEGLYQYKSTGWEAIGGAVSDTNIFNTSGTLTGHRVIYGGSAWTFTIQDINTFTVDTTSVTNNVAVFKATEPNVVIQAMGASNGAALFLNPSNSGINGSIHNRTGGGLEFYVGSTPSVKQTIKATGQIQFNGYTSTGSFSGTAAGYLGFDSSGNIITTTGVGGITLTTTGSSGAATWDGTTLNIPIYSGGGGGSVTTVSVVSANGFAGTVANATSTPAITLTTTVSGILKGNSTSISAATAGLDYQAPITLTTTGTSGAATLIGNTLNIPNYAVSNNLYNSNGTLTGDRTISSGGFTLTIQPLTYFLDAVSIEKTINGSFTSIFSNLSNGSSANSGIQISSDTSAGGLIIRKNSSTASVNPSGAIITNNTAGNIHITNSATTGDMKFFTYTASAGMTIGAMGIFPNQKVSVGYAVSGNSNFNINTANLPTSSAGLVSGDVWRNGNVLTIVP